MIILFQSISSFRKKYLFSNTSWFRFNLLWCSRVAGSRITYSLGWLYHTSNRNQSTHITLNFLTLSRKVHIKNIKVFPQMHIWTGFVYLRQGMCEETSMSCGEGQDSTKSIVSLCCLAITRALIYDIFHSTCQELLLARKNKDWCRS